MDLFPKNLSVYVMQSGKHYKIGYSSKVKERWKMLDASTPLGVKLVWSFESKYAEYLERLLHYYLRDKHFRREWFLLSKDDVAFIKEVVPQINNERFIATVWQQVSSDLVKSPVYYQGLNMPSIPSYKWIDPERDKHIFTKF